MVLLFPLTAVLLHTAEYNLISFKEIVYYLLDFFVFYDILNLIGGSDLLKYRHGTYYIDDTLTVRNGTYYIDDNILIRHEKNDISEEIHNHDFIEMVYIVSGSCVHIVDGKEYLMKSGCLLFIKNNQNHSIITNQKVEFLNILVNPEFINEGLLHDKNVFSMLPLNNFESFCNSVTPENCMIKFKADERERFESLIKLIEYEETTSMQGYRITIRSLLNVFLVTIFRKMSLPIVEEHMKINSELLSYIYMHCDEDLSLEKLAAECNYSKSHFSRAFKKLSGMPLTEFVLNARLEKAKYLLENTNMKVNEIIAEISFANNTKFFTSFKEKYGKSPHKYRKEQY